MWLFRHGLCPWLKDIPDLSGRYSYTGNTARLMLFGNVINIMYNIHMRKNNKTKIKTTGAAKQYHA
jgi:hypothetical protein